MITIHDAKAADFTTLGLGALLPSECTIRERAGGMYELKIVHPITDDGRHHRIKPMRIIKAPAPVRETPLVEIGQTGTIYRDIYKVVTDGRRLYLRVKPDQESKGLHAYKPGTEVVSMGLSDDGKWRRVAILDGGATGWMWAGNLEFVRTETEIIVGDTPGGIVQPRQTREQLFRVYRYSPDSKERAVTAEARHITYDLAGAIVEGEYSPENVPANQVCAQIMARADHDVSDFHIYCTVSTPISGEYGGRNILDCLLDPETGVVAQTKARIVRDNYDIFILPDEVRSRGIELRYGKNLLSAYMDTDVSDTITRIKPVGKTKGGEQLYIEENNGWVESPYIDDYPVIYSKEVEYDVVESDELPIKQARALLKEKAEADFAAGCDMASVKLDADFARLELTDDYRHLANQYALHLYDSVPVIDREAGIVATARMTEYVYDAILDEYQDTGLGELDDVKSTIYGYELATGSVSGGKLIPNTVNGDRLQNSTVSYGKFDLVAIKQLSADAIVAIRAEIHKLVVGEITADELYADLAKIAVAEIKEAKIDWAQIENAQIEAADIVNLSAEVAKLVKAEVENLEVDWAGIYEADIEWANIANLTAEIAKITAAEIGKAKINWAQIVDVKIGTADIEDATITTAKIALGAITSALIKAGAIGTAQIADGSITDAKIVSLNADVIKTGTLSADRLLIKGTGGLFYEINATAGGLTSTQLTQEQYKNAISGTALVARSVTADKIAAKSITANEILGQTITAAEINVANLFAADATISALNNYILRTQTIEAIEGKLDVWASEKIRLAVDNIRTGATNLLTGTKLIQTGTTAADWRIGQPDITAVYMEDDGFSRIRFKASGYTENTWASCASPVTKLPYGWQGRKITLSMWVYAQDWAGMNGSTLSNNAVGICLSQGGASRLNWASRSINKTGKVELSDGVYSDVPFVNGKWIRVSMTWTLDETDFISGTGDFDANTHVFVQFFLVRNGYYAVYAPKLEFGSKSSEWSPAPEDMDREIGKVYAELLVQAGEISANAAKIETVKGTADKAATDLTEVTKRVTTAETTISAVDAEVKTKVSQTDFNALGERVSSAEGSITTQAGRITANTTAVQKAQSTANSAQTAAGNAQTTADAAKSQADANKTNLGNVTTRVTTAEQAISALDGKIATKVEKTTYEGLVGDVGDLEKVVESHSTLIEQTAEDILLQAGRTVGGSNYLRDSAERLTGSAFFMGEYYFSNGLKPKAGENVTIRIWGDLGNDRTAFGIWNTNGYIPIGSLTNNGDGTFSGTFEWKVDSANYPEYSVTEDTQKGIQIYVLPKTGTTASTIKKIKLERGDYATDWTPHPEDPSAGVNTGEDGSVRVKITPDYFNVDVPGEDGDFILNEAGGQLPVLRSDYISAPNVTPRYDGPGTIYVDPNATGAQIAAGNYCRSLADAVTRLNHRWVDKTISIRLAAGVTEYGNISLQGIGGGCWVQIIGDSANRAKLVGRLNLLFNTSPVSVSYLNIDAASMGINAEGCQTVSLSNGIITGPGGDVSSSRGIRAARSGSVSVWNCEIYDFERSLFGEAGGVICAYNCKGNCRVGATRSTLYLSGTMPCDSTTWAQAVYAGQVLTSNLTIDQGSKPTPEAAPATTAFSYLYSDSYRGGWQYFTDSDPRQGYDGQPIYGVIWFDTAAMRAAIDSRTVKQASLRLHMHTGVGRGTAVSVQLYGTNAAYSGRVNQPGLTTEYGVIGSANPGEINEITIPAQVINDLLQGTIGALVLKSGDTDFYKGRQYSKNYARFSGSSTATTENCPKLTVVYQ